MCGEIDSNDDWKETAVANAWTRPAFECMRTTTTAHSVKNSAGIDGVPR